MAENPYDICAKCGIYDCQHNNIGGAVNEDIYLRLDIKRAWQEGYDAAKLQWRPITDEPPGDKDG